MEQPFYESIVAQSVLSRKWRIGEIACILIKKQHEKPPKAGQKVNLEAFTFPKGALCIVGYCPVPLHFIGADGDSPCLHLEATGLPV